jgi:hypothetical protein
VSLLKKYRGPPPSTPPQMPIMHEGAAILGLEQMIKTKLHRGNLHVLVKWKGQLVANIPARGQADSPHGKRCHGR